MKRQRLLALSLEKARGYKEKGLSSHDPLLERQRHTYEAEETMALLALTKCLQL